jgi:hypothetical protein
VDGNSTLHDDLRGQSVGTDPQRWGGGPFPKRSVDGNSALHDDLRGQSVGIEVIPDLFEPAIALSVPGLFEDSSHLGPLPVCISRNIYHKRMLLTSRYISFVVC